MGKGIGRQIQFGIAKETSRGTAEAAATFWIPWTSLALDEKIELNRQMNETLEAMAQALFKSWFVDFDPVMFGPGFVSMSPAESRMLSNVSDKLLALRYSRSLPAKLVEKLGTHLRL